MNRSNLIGWRQIFFKPVFDDDKIVFTCESLKTIMEKGE